VNAREFFGKWEKVFRNNSTDDGNGDSYRPFAIKSFKGESNIDKVEKRFFI